MYLTVELQSPFLFLKHHPLSTDGQWHLRVHLRAHTHDGAEKPDAARTQAQQEGKPWHGTFSLYIYQNSLSGFMSTSSKLHKVYGCYFKNKIPKLHCTL